MHLSRGTTHVANVFCPTAWCWRTCSNRQWQNLPISSLKSSPLAISKACQYNVQLEHVDYDMTAGEQIIYEMKRESWEREEKAREDGENIEKKRIAKSLKDLNVAPETIEKSTGLTLEQINML